MKFVAALFVLMLAVGGLSFAVFRAAPGAGCEDLLLEDVLSPGGRQIAARFSHRCGTAPPAVEVALRTAGTPFAPDERATVLAARGDRPLRLSWRDSQTLVIESERENILEPRTEWRNVALIYRRIH
ncbi:MAG: hypothetical protein NVSMB23_03710 [Myxococcales bacterium]